MHPSNPAEGFPWNRVNAASRYLYAIKPWWSSFGRRMKIVPINVPEVRDGSFGGLTSTDKNLSLYVDRQFALNAPLHLVSGAIEHSLQNHVRNVWSRMSWMNDDDRESYFNLCVDLEINSAIRSETDMMNMDLVRRVILGSSQFSERELDMWNVTAPPGLDQDGWQPSMLDMPEGKSAETYYRIIKDRNLNPEDNSGEGDQEEQEESAKSESEPEDSDSSEDDQSDNSETEESDSDSDASDDEAEDDRDNEESQSDESADEENEDSSGDSEGDGSGENEDESEPSAQSDSESEDGEDDIEEDSEPSESDSSSSPSEEDEDSESSSDSETDQSSGTSNSESGSPSDSDSQSQSQSQESGQSGTESTSGNSVDDQIEKMAVENPLLRWWMQELPQGDEPEWMDTSERKESDRVTEEMLKEFSEDVAEAAMGSAQGFSLKPGSSILDLSLVQLERSGVRWTSVIEKRLDACLSSVKTMGGADLSYSVRNPNQGRRGPVLMGMHAWAPKIYVLIDVSGSMRNDLGSVMGTFSEIVRTTLSRYGDAVTWISVDAAVVDVDSTFRFSSEERERIGTGFGGTALGPTLEELIDGKFVWERKRHPKPDLLVVLTDCMFSWPRMKQTRLKSPTKVVVASTKNWDEVSHRIPEWVDAKRDFVRVDTLQ